MISKCYFCTVQNLRKNIVSIILTAVLLTSGNFAFAVSHADCFSDETGHHKCEMECCKEGDCCAEDGKAVEITDQSGGCCETHIEQAVEQEDAVLIVNNKVDIQKLSLCTPGICISIYSSEDFSVITHKFKTTNIPIVVSNLRI